MTRSAATNLPIDALRRLARRMGETGGTLLVIAAMTAGDVMIDRSDGIGLIDLAGVVLFGAVALCVVARWMDGWGQRAARGEARRLASPADQLDAWRRAPGPLGRAWGALLPSARLLRLSSATART